MAKTNPLNAFAQGQTASDFRLKPLPRLADHVSQHGLIAGIQHHTEAMQQWADELVKTVQAKLQPKSASTVQSAAVTPTTEAKTVSTVVKPPVQASVAANKLWVSSLNPTNGMGAVGDVWINTSALTLFGPKTSTGWGPAVSLFPISNQLASGALALTSGANSGTVSDLALPFTPLVIPSVRGPLGGLTLTASVVAGSESRDGFQFQLSAATDSDQYQLTYILVPYPGFNRGIVSGLTGAGGDVVTGAGGDVVTGAGES